MSDEFAEEHGEGSRREPGLESGERSAGEPQSEGDLRSERAVKGKLIPI
jgi:hypothetical protein